MELIIDTKEFNIFESEVPKEVVGYNFYSMKGTFYSRERVGQSGYPRAPHRIIVNLNGEERELRRGDKLYLIEDGKYFIGNEV